MITLRDKRWYGLAAIGLAAGAVWVARARAQGHERSAPPPPVAREIVAPATVEGRSETLELGFETAGRVAEVLVREGDQVARGQLLARLDDRLARARLAQTEAALDLARARRDAVFRGARPDEVRAAQAEAEAAEADARKQETSANRVERLFAAGAATAEERDRVRGTAEATRAQAEAAAARLALVRAGSRGEQRREAAASVEAAEAERETARVLLSQTELRAPIAGLVLRRRTEPGVQVAALPPTVVLTMCDLSRRRLRAEVDEADVSNVRPGQPGAATAEAFGERRFGGRVVEVMSELGRKRVRTDDPRARVDTRVLELLFELDGDPVLPLGLRMDLHLPAQWPR